MVGVMAMVGVKVLVKGGNEDGNGNGCRKRSFVQACGK